MEVSVGRSKQYDMVDFVKFVGSIMIFTMHGKAFGDNKYLLFIFELLTRWAVPFFFIISSYFLEKKIMEKQDDRADIIRHYCKRLFGLYMVWLLINLPSIIESRLIGKDLSSFITWLIFLKNSVLSSTFKGSWYLVSSIFSAYLIYWIFRNMSVKRIVLITLPIGFLCVITSIYSGLLPDKIKIILCNILCFPLNLFCGVFYFAIGKYLYKHSLLFFKSREKKFFLVLVSYILFIGEVGLAKIKGYLGMTDVSFLLVPIAVLITDLSLNSKIYITSHKKLRQLSTLIYCSQGNVFLITSIIAKKCKAMRCFTLFLISAVICVCICIIILLIDRNKKCKLLRRLT